MKAWNTALWFVAAAPTTTHAPAAGHEIPRSSDVVVPAGTGRLLVAAPQTPCDSVAIIGWIASPPIVAVQVPAARQLPWVGHAIEKKVPSLALEGSATSCWVRQVPMACEVAAARWLSGASERVPIVVHAPIVRQAIAW